MRNTMGDRVEAVLTYGSVVLFVLALILLFFLGVGTFYDVSFTANLMLQYRSTLNLFTILFAMGMFYILFGFAETAWRDESRSFSHRVGWVMFFSVFLLMALLKIIISIVTL